MVDPGLRGYPCLSAIMMAKSLFATFVIASKDNKVPLFSSSKLFKGQLALTQGTYFLFSLKIKTEGGKGANPCQCPMTII